MLRGTTAFGLRVLIDDEDFKWLNQSKWFINRGGYAWTAKWNPVTKKQETFRMHRQILARHLGRSLLPTDLVEHRDQNKLNNGRANLRLGNKSLNSANRGAPRSNTSGYKGVTKMYAYKNGKRYDRRKPWTAQIKNNYVHYNLGYFATKEEAAQAYDVEARRLFGVFASTNFSE